MKTFFVYLGLAVNLVLFWLLWASYSTHIPAFFLGVQDALSVEQTGQWSDGFGGFNAIVSALGFAAVLATLWFQSAALKSQANDQHRQRFEDTLFELFRMLRDARAEMRFRHSEDYQSRYSRFETPQNSLPSTLGGPRKRSETIVGAGAIAAAVTELRFWLSSGKTSRADSKALAEVYGERIHSMNEATFAPYYRLIYTILNRLREDRILTEIEKASYGNLLRSQLTSEEIILLAFNGLTPAAKDLQQLITDFRMLKYLPPSSVRRRIEQVYDCKAFESRD